MLTDTIPTPGWWLVLDGYAAYYGEVIYRRAAIPFSSATLGAGLRVEGYTNNPEAVLAWVRDGVLP